MRGSGSRLGRHKTRGPYGDGRVTVQRAAISAAVEAASGAFTADRLAAAVRAGGAAVGTATVYRAIAAMVAAGHLERVGEAPAGSLYVRCKEPEHHHHLVCTGCGSVAHAPCPLDASALGSAADQGFTVTGHDLAIYGLCARCLGSPSARGRA